MDIFERAVNNAGDAVSPRVAKPVKLPLAREQEANDRQGVECRIDLESLHKSGYLTPGRTQTRQAEEYRLLKRPVLMNAFGKGSELIERGNLVAVTSALPGDGKTFTSLNLAMSISQEQDRTVLLIDADLSKRSLSHLLGLDQAKGLIDVLKGDDVSLSDVINRTNIPKLRVIPAGSPSPDVTELMASEQMESLMAELAARYDDRIILLDTPPLLSTSQAQILTHLVGQTLMVVREGKTPQSAIDEALDMLEENDVVGMVLNYCGRSKGSSYYGGYYGGSEDREG
ncbi:Non-specific protein-tyrosine kinase [Thioalkalivibrio sulfidiphilus HL-EbGr7]|uniref:non-specific protein-tyrosine kinase n=1 Tax=Thioalkalivibrio sulfidiphilus (strain HL-EbGR7) TaxID=396588 RepID=B8GVC2_THISH|nr:XrtA-associated tyrosine autokinase [Thioalkalivibrio sulfidiphilus]ACL73468.1 Non-specific protein-tyrosine kinase [Thioalkalivibrio sulfidiphilus HL-EbGr7]